jgi:8-oxo-dGTP pyrophosphatase MutT (NUDIX family)
MMNWSPHITVASVLEQNQTFLFVEEKIDGQLVLNQPAGHWEQGESILEASIRETLEETAWHYRPTHLVGIYQWTHPQSSQTYLRFCLTGELLEHEPQRKLDVGILRAVWLSHEELINRSVQHRSPLVRQCLDDYINGKRFDISLLQIS